MTEEEKAQRLVDITAACQKHTHLSITYANGGSTKTWNKVDGTWALEHRGGARTSLAMAKFAASKVTETLEYPWLTNYLRIWTPNEDSWRNPTESK